MRVFVTGANGFIGSRIVHELLAHGHQVLGLTRSDVGARWLEQAGAKVHRGTLEDPGSLARGAAQADAVIHTAFDHDFANFAGNCEKDRRVIEAMGAALEGSDRPLLITSGTGMGSATRGVPATRTCSIATTPIRASCPKSPVPRSPRVASVSRQCAFRMCTTRRGRASSRR